MKKGMIAVSTLCLSMMGCVSVPTEGQRLELFATRIDKAQTCMKQKKFGEALDSYKACYAIDPKSNAVLLGLARAYRELKSYDNSIKYYLEYFQVIPDDGFEYFWLGDLYWQQKASLDKGEYYYTKSIEFVPNHGWSYHHRGLVRQQKGDLPNARLDFEKAIEIAKSANDEDLFLACSKALDSFKQ